MASYLLARALPPSDTLNAHLSPFLSRKYIRKRGPFSVPDPVVNTSKMLTQSSATA